MAIVPLNSLVESVHRDVICHSSSPPLGHVVAETCCGNALIVVSLAQPPTIAPAPFGRAQWKHTEASAHPQLNPRRRSYGRGQTTHAPALFGMRLEIQRRRVIGKM